MSGEKIPVWSWRQAIEKSELKPFTCLLLHTIANDISDCGKFTRRTVDQLVTATRMSRSAVCAHLVIAKDAGFLVTKRSRNGFGHVLATKYYPKFPKQFALLDEPAEDAETQSPGKRLWDENDGNPKSSRRTPRRSRTPKVKTLSRVCT